MNNNLNTFIEDHFNVDTTMKQVEIQNKIISMAKREIERLTTLTEAQKEKQWYEYDGVKFSTVVWYSYDSYRSHGGDVENFKSYDDFIAKVISILEPDSSIEGSFDYQIISPTGSRIVFDYETAKSLPMVKEYFERNEVMNILKVSYPDLEDIISEIERLEIEMSLTQKYTPEFIHSFAIKRDQLVEEKNKLEKNIAEEDSNSHRLVELNHILVDIDKLLEDED
jgi:hypothetical protein